MANICCSQYVVEGEMSELKDLYEKMKSLEEGTAPVVDAAEGNTWVANLINLLGGDWENLECGGSFYEVKLDEERGLLTYNIESKWIELEEVRDFISEQYPSLIIYFRAEEPGCDIFETNDLESKYFERHKVSYYNVDWERVELYFFTQEEMFAKMNELMDVNVGSIEEMQREFEDYNSDSDVELCYNYFEKPSPNLF